MAAEAHRIRERQFELDLARLVRDVVEVALRIGVAVALIVGGSSWWWSASAHIIDSIMPAAPKRCGQTDFVEETASLVGVAAEDLLDRPRLGRVAERRRGSVRVDVADPLRLDVKRSSAARIIPATPVASGSGCAMWWASFEAP